MKVLYKNMEVQVNENERVIDAFEEEIQNNKNTIACFINNEVKNLNYPLKEGDEIKFIDTTTRDGGRIYTRGLLFIMSMAFKQLYPDIKLNINFQLRSSMFCELLNEKVTEEMLKNIKNRMDEIIKADYPIKKIEVDRETVLKFLAVENTGITVAQLENKERKNISAYECNGYYNYFFGVMPISTKYIQLYDLMKYEDGFLIRYPTKNNPNEVGPYYETKKLLNTLSEYDDIYKLLGNFNLDQINEKIRTGRGKELVLLAEALHEKKIAEIANEIAKNKDKKIILIAGPSSSGKTTFAKRLGVQLRLNGLIPETISVDNYFVDREHTPIDEDGKPDYEALEAVDLELLNDHLTKLLNGEEIDVPTFDFKEGHKYYTGKKMKLEPDEVLVMEGIHCLNDNLTPLIPKDKKYKVYVSALTVLNIDYYNRISTTDTRVVRRIARDNQFRGYDAKHTLEVWPSVSKGEEKNIFPYQEEADSMFNSALVYEINALKDYVLPLLQNIHRDDEQFAEAKRLSEFLKYFESIDTELIPKNSILQEFLGNSIFDY